MVQKKSVYNCSFMRLDPQQLHTGMIETVLGNVTLIPVICQQILNLSY